MPAAGPRDTALPHGLRVRLDRRVRVLDGGAALLGGAPPRLLHLAPVARRLLAGGVFTVDDPTSAALARRLLDAGAAHPEDPPPGAVPSAADVTLVVPVRDRADGLARLLAALTARCPHGVAGRPAGRGAGAAARPGDPRDRDRPGPDDPRRPPPRDRCGPARVLVVDDGSADPAAVRAAAGRAGAAVLRHVTPRGPAAARNTGLAAATTELVAFLDSDVVPEPGWLAPLLAAFADPAVGLAAPRIVALPPVTGWLGRYEAVRSSLDLGPDPAPVVPRSRVAYVPSAALLVRRAAAGAGFDEAMRVAEDVDLVLRLHAAGWRLRYAPTARVAHDHRTGLRAWWLRKAFYGTGAAPLALRHPGAVPPAVVGREPAAVVGLLLLGRPLAALAVGAVAAERLARALPRLRRPRATAVRLVALATAGAAAQTADAITRHHWPVAAAAALVSRRARRAVALVAVAEGLVDRWRRRGRAPGLGPGPVGHLLARRLDDLAYGTGLWWGAARHRTWAPLRPVVVGARDRPRGGAPARPATHAD